MGEMRMCIEVLLCYDYDGDYLWFIGIWIDDSRI